LIRHRGDAAQAERLDDWLTLILSEYHDNILHLDENVAQIWGRLRVPHPENALDKQIAATALIHDLTVVTCNEKHFAGTGARLLNPFQ
jgi:toxin FitB